MRAPDYNGGGLVNLIAELEFRLTGMSASHRLAPHLANAVPEARTYVFVLFDALGDLQLRAHPDGRRLLDHRAGALDASFSSQTSVATSTLATGLPPSQHGLISYILRLPEADTPVNTLWWFDAGGNPVEVDHAAFLPTPNLAERLADHGVEAVVVEPDAFLGSPLDRVLYRGTRARGVVDQESIVETVLEEASESGRVVLCYLPNVDAAGHAEGTKSDSYSEALRLVTATWEGIGAGLPEHAAMVGTADHGMVDVSQHVEIGPPPTLTLYGDSRVVYVAGDAGDGERLAAGLPCTWATGDALTGLWGPGPFHPEFERRRPDGLIMAEPGVGFLYPGNRTLLAGYHGGLSEEELRIPLLVYVAGDR